MRPLELTVERHATHIEVRWSGDVPDVLPMPSPYDSMPDGSLVLVDASGLQDASHPVLRWAGVAAKVVERGLKIAVVSPPGLIFGLYRQALHTAGVDQERSISLFRGRAEALAWLLADGEPAANFRPDE